MWLGEYPEDHTTVVCMFTTHSSSGAPLAPSTAFEADDVRIYKNGNAAQKTTTNGVTMTSPFDSVTGLHCVVIDTSNDTGDSGFWTTGGGDVFTLVLSPDETVDSISVAKVIGQFGIELSRALRPTTAGRKLDVSSTGEAGIDWANIGSPTTSQTLSSTTIGTATAVTTVNGLAAGSITAAAVATGAIDADALATDAVDEIVDAVWDEPLTGATHNVSTSAGQRLRQLSGSVIESGTAQSGSTVNTIKLATAASSTNGTYDPAIIRIVSGTGSGQARLVLDYTGSTRVAVVDRDWRTTPDNTSVYEIIAAPNLTSTNEGLAQGGSSTTITLNASASATNDIYRGQTVVIRTGTGQDQSRIITAYNGTTKVATLGEAWITAPDSASGYMILQTGRVLVTAINPDVITASALAADAVTEIATGIDAPTADENADALLDRVDAVEAGLTVRQALRLSAAADGGKLSGAATATNTIRNAVADSKNRIVATVDADGNRTAITYDLS